MKLHLVCFTLFILLSCFSCRERVNSHQGELNKDVVENISGKAIDLDSLEIYISEQMRIMKIPGCSFALINDGKVVYHKVFGEADKETRKPVMKSTLFEGASTSKPLFAYMIMILVENGLLDLDTPLAKYLDEGFHSNYNFDPRYSKITARMVLSHSTGFPNWRGNGNLTISFDPGSNFSYSGEGYQMLVRAVESILNTDYRGLERYFEEKIANPLGMKYSKFVQDEYNRLNKATPHKNGQALAKNMWTAQEFNAASALHTEAIDFSKWIIALMEYDILPKESIDKLFEDQITVEVAPSILTEEGAVAWTLGFSKYDQKGHILYGHEGNNDGFNALFLISRERKWAMIQFNNANEVYDFGYNIFGYLHNN